MTSQDIYTKKYSLQKREPRNFFSEAKRNRPKRAIVVIGMSRYVTFGLKLGLSI